MAASKQTSSIKVLQLIIMNMNILLFYFHKCTLKLSIQYHKTVDFQNFSGLICILHEYSCLFLQESQCQITGIPLILQHFGYIVKTRKDCQFTLSLTGTAWSVKMGIWLYSMKNTKTSYSYKKINVKEQEFT